MGNQPHKTSRTILQPDKFGDTSDPDKGTAKQRYNYEAIKGDYREDDSQEEHVDKTVIRTKYIQGYKCVLRSFPLFWIIEIPEDRVRETALPVELQGQFTDLSTLERVILKSRGKME